MRQVNRRAFAIPLAVLVGAWASHASVASAGQQCTSASTVSGADLEASGTLGWSSAKADIGFAIIKATQGTSFTASGFASNWAAMKSAGVVRGAYHFFDPTVSGVDQANYFLNVMGTLEAGDLPPTLDIECPTSNNEPDSDDCLGNGTSGDATGAELTQGMNDWITTVVAKTGRKPLIYSYGSYFSDLGVTTTGLDAYPLWIADYSGTSCFEVPSPWTKATIWQYSGSGSISGLGSVDNDYFLGTLAELTAFTTSGVSPTGDAGASGSGSGTGGMDTAPDAGGASCSLPNGDPGECLDTTVCDALGGTYMPTAGYCPGAANIQCCTGMPAAGTGSKDGGASASGSTPDGGSTTHSATGTGAGSASSSGIVQGSSIVLRSSSSTGESPHDEPAADGGFGTSGASGGCSAAATTVTEEGWFAFVCVGAVVAARRRSRAASAVRRSSPNE